MKKLTLLTTFILVTLLVAACTNLTADGEQTFETLAAPADFVVSTNGRLNARFERTVARNGDALKHFYPDAGFAVVTTDRPGDYRRFADIVERDLVAEWIDPSEYRVDLGSDAANPPTSGDDDFFFDLQWGHDAVNAPEAWDAGQRGAGVRVFVLDGGFDVDHPDLAPNVNLALSTDFTGQGIDYCQAVNPNDPFSHGTHTAGTVGAADNAFGSIGVAPDVELVLVKVLSDVDDGTGFCTGSGSFGDVIAGILYAASNDADVISMSIGASFQAREDTGPGRLTTATSRATTYAYQSGAVMIASAGNEATDYDHSQDLVHLPSDAAHVISISATGPNGWGVDPTTDLSGLAFYSNFGQSTIDFSAPGGDVDFDLLASGANCLVASLLRPCYVFDFVFSTGSNGGWYWSIGTSMAAPHAAGVAALIIGENGGEMNPAHVERELRARAADLGKRGNDDVHGGGAFRTGF